MLEIIADGDARSLEPLTCRRSALEIELAGTTLHGALEQRWMPAADGDVPLKVVSAFWPSHQLVEKLRRLQGGFTVMFQKEKVAERGDGALLVEPDPSDTHSFPIVYPWDFLAVNEDMLAEAQGKIAGTVHDRAVVNGVLILGEGSVILPGVYIEGVAVIGRNCKIGPNCYLRGFTAIGDGCHAGQAVEIKNSILMSRVAAGHLSYVGDSIICPGTNLGAGTIMANFRHDGRNHRSSVNGVLVNTGRRKFGAILGDGVHTGIHSAIYPGRKIWLGVSLRPGTVVQRDITKEQLV